MSRYRLGLLVLIAVLEGCATSPQDSCATADWYAVGYEDGRTGHASGPVAGRAGACGGQPGAADVRRYALGRDAGLVQYCKPRSGFQLGLGGQRYNAVCPREFEQDFLSAYRVGQEIHDRELQVHRLDTILAVNEAELDKLDESLLLKQAELLRHAGNARRRAQLLAELQELEETVAMVEAEIDGIEAALLEERGQLLSLKHSNRHW